MHNRLTHAQCAGDYVRVPRSDCLYCGPFKLAKGTLKGTGIFVGKNELDVAKSLVIDTMFLECLS